MYNNGADLRHNLCLVGLYAFNKEISSAFIPSKSEISFLSPGRRWGGLLAAPNLKPSFLAPVVIQWFNIFLPGPNKPIIQVCTHNVALYSTD